MGVFIDTSIGILVIIVFLYLIYIRLARKFPSLGEGMSEYFPFMKSNKPESLEPKEMMKQTWSEQRGKL